MHRYNIPLFWIGLMLTVLSGCGGGDSTGAALVYQGETQPARISAQNAAILADNVLASTDLASAVNALRTQKPPVTNRIGLLPMVLLLRAKLEISHSGLANRDGDSTPAAREIDDVINCMDGGTMVIHGDIGDDGSGQLTLDLADCREGSETTNGRIHTRIDASNIVFAVLTDFTMSFSNFTVAGDDYRVSIGGMLEVKRELPVFSEHMTVNMVARDENSGDMIKLENLVIDSTRDSLLGTVSRQVSISGRMFDSKLGYVDITTVAPLVYLNAMRSNPAQGGQLLLTGALDSRVKLIAASEQKLRLEIDSAGSGRFDQHQVYYWTDIGGTPAPNEPPRINNGVIQPVIAYTTDDLVVDLSRIQDPDGDPVTYNISWSRNGETLLGQSDIRLPALQHGKGDEIGLHLSLSDGLHTINESTFVSIHNSPPVVDAGIDIHVTFGDAVNLQGSAVDADGDPLEITWSLPNPGPFSHLQLNNANALNAQLDYLLPESATARLTVSDGEATGRDEVEVVIQPMPLFKPYQRVAIPTDTETVTIGDLNSDGLNDLIVSSSYNRNPNATGSVYVLLQDSSGNLSAPIHYDTGLTPNFFQVGSTAIADMNHDGRRDLVLSIANGVGVMLQNEQGTLEPVTSYLLTNDPGFDDSYLVVAADFNDDGKDDVASIGWGTQSNEVDVFLQNGAAALDNPVSYLAPHGGGDDLAFGDLNADGRNDLVVMSGQGFLADNFSVVLQQADKSFAAPVPYDLGFDVNGGAIAVGDVNGDSRDDVVLAYGGNRPSSNIAVFYQNSAGALDAPIILPSHDIPSAVEIADIDGDSLLDIIVSHSGWSSMSIYLQKADGTLLGEQLYPFIYSNRNPHRLAVGDINADGKNDIVEADGDGIVILYQ